MDYTEYKLSDGYTYYLIDSVTASDGLKYYLWEDSIAGDYDPYTVTCERNKYVVIGYTPDDLDTWLAEHGLEV